MGPASKARLALVNPQLADTIYDLEDRLKRKCQLGVTQGVRKPVEQRVLWMQGRFELSEINGIRKVLKWAPITQEENAKTVTNAKPGESWHEFGMAVDVLPMDLDTGQPDWNDEHPIWQLIVDTGERFGLTSGEAWNDRPHFQLTGRFPTSPTEEARQILATSGMQAVWQAAGLALQLGGNGK